MVEHSERERARANVSPHPTSCVLRKLPFLFYKVLSCILIRGTHTLQELSMGGLSSLSGSTVLVCFCMYSRLPFLCQPRALPGFYFLLALGSHTFCLITRLHLGTHRSDRWAGHWRVCLRKEIDMLSFTCYLVLSLSATSIAHYVPCELKHFSGKSHVPTVLVSVFVSLTATTCTEQSLWLDM